VLHVIGVVTFFGLIGPFIGGILAITGLAVWTAPPSPRAFFGTVLLMMSLGLWMAYWAGFIPALVVGLIIGCIDAFRGGTSPHFAIALGIAAGIAWQFTMTEGNGPSHDFIRILGGVSCFIATVACWYATRWKTSA
jgi:hypothetical protein